MPRRIAIQMDPPHRLNPASDSTIALAEAAQARGYETFYFLPHSLALHADGRLTARLRRWHLSLTSDPWWREEESVVADLHEFDHVLMRQDPPFDLHYITATYLLEQLGNKVVNNPASVRNAPEKLTPYLFPEYQPPTLVSADSEALHAFAREHGDIVLKPLHGFGGNGVFRFKPGDGNLETLLEVWLAGERPIPLVAQPFLPAVAERELRVILINGQIAASFRRQPASGEIRSNMRVGGTPLVVELTQQERAIAEKIGAWAAPQGLLLVGLDLIGGYLGEINVTCPTGLRAAQKLYGLDLAQQVWDAIEAAA